MSTLTLLRHGQALFGAEHYDGLSDTGKAQAEVTATFFAERNIVFDRILCGTLSRQRQTAEAVAARQPGAPLITVDAALDEFADPSQILLGAEQHFKVPAWSSADMPRDEKLRHYNALIREWAQGKAAIPEGPTSEQFRQRVGAWLDALTEASGSGVRILAVTSGGTIGACLAHLLNLPNAHIADAAGVLGNCSFTDILFSSRRRNLQSFNTTAHLPAAMSSGI